MARAEKVVIAVFIDALGWKIVKDIGFLDNVLIVKQPVTTVLGYSSTCIPTILTGKLPREHGHFSSYYYDPAHSPFRLVAWLRLLPKLVSERAMFRRAVSRAFVRVAGWDGYFDLYKMPFEYLSLYDYCEKRDIYKPGGIVGGCRTFLDDFRERRVPFVVADWRCPEGENVVRVRDMIDRAQIVFAYLMLTSLDGAMHQLGPECEVVRRILKTYEGWLQSILAAAEKRYREVRVHVFSDHGMTRVREACNVGKIVEDTGAQFGSDYVAVYDSTMARFWFLNETTRQKVESALAREERGELLSQEALRLYGCDFLGHRYGEVFYLMKPGVVIHPSFASRSVPAGMHGYDPNHEDSVAAFMSSVDGVEVPRALVEIADFLRREVLG